MARDMRLDIDFVDHPKTKRLIRTAGFEGFYCLLKLFSSVAKAYPKGELTGCDQYDIENLADWRGESGLLFEALTDPDFYFLEKAGEHWRVHEWDVHQPWVFNSKERSEIARQNVKKRWDKSQTPYEQDTNGIPIVIRNRYESLTQNTPSPSPSPIDKEKTPLDTVVSSPPRGKPRFMKPEVEEVKAYCDERKNTIDPQHFIDYYEANGWKVGKNPMKDWKACIRTWEKRNTPRQETIRHPQDTQDNIKPARSIFDDLEDEQGEHK